MNQVSTVGLDLAKYTFQLHGADSAGAVVFRKKLRRGQLLAFLATLPPCTVAMEACGSAHYWGRAIAKLGHTVRLIAPAYVKPFVKRQKNDAADAEAICEAAQRPTMRFVALKSANQQAAAVVFRTRDLLVRQRTQTINALRGHLTEFGVIAAKGPVHTSKLIAALEDPASDLPQAARAILAVLVEELRSLDERVGVLDREIARHAKENAVARRLMTIPGIGAVTAAALTALAPPAQTFRRGRDFAAWLGLTPVQRSSGGKERLGKTSKMGERALRRLLIIGASAVARWAARKGVPGGSWLGRMLARKPPDAGAGGAGQQDGPDRLGAAGARWGLSSSGCGGVGVATTARLLEGQEGRRRGWRDSRETGSGKPALRQALQARGPDLDLIPGLPSGPAAWNAPQQRPNTCQHPTTCRTALEDFSCSSRGVHTCRKLWWRPHDGLCPSPVSHFVNFWKAEAEREQAVL